MRLPLFSPSPFVLAIAVLIALAATLIRLEGSYWDQLVGFHPDERHMLFIVARMLERWAEAPDLPWHQMWLHTGISPLDPRLEGQNYVYGELPVLAMALLAKGMGISEWESLMLMGRQVSALIDGTTTLAVFMIAFKASRSAWAALTAMILYAVAPTALQLSNFFTVDIWLTAAWTWCSYFLLAALTHRGQGVVRLGGVAGVFAGLALACKLPALLLALPALLVCLIRVAQSGFGQSVKFGMWFGLCAYVVARLANPFAFAGPGLEWMVPSDAFIGSIAALSELHASDYFPPNWYWQASYEPWMFARDFVLFGTGPIIATGVILSVRPLAAGWAKVLLLIGSVPLLLWTAQDFVPALRYAAPAIPLLSVLAGSAIAGLRPAAPLILVAGACYWGSAVAILHSADHPRLAASRWIWTLPSATTLINETDWDESLPAPVVLVAGEGKVWSNSNGHFTLLNAKITERDADDIAGNLAMMLAAGDYYIMSSDRQLQGLGALPEAFPVASGFYELLFSGDLCYALAWEGISTYPLPGLAFRYPWVQEPWRVYTHPSVRIFEKEKCFDERNAAAALAAHAAQKR